MLPIFSIYSTCKGKLPAILCIFLFSHFARGQDQTVRFNPYTMDQGMSQNSVYMMIQDASGFLWLGTQDGLNRFDGYAFKQFHHSVDDTTSLADDHVLSLHETQDRQLWIGTRSGGLHRYEPQTESFTRFSIPALLQDSLGIQYEPIHIIREIGKDSLILGTDIGAFFFDVQRNEERLLRYGENPDTSVRAIEIDRNSYLWIGDNRGELYKSQVSAAKVVDENSFGFIPIATRHRIESLFEDRFGDMWIATLGSGIFKYDISSERTAGSPLYDMSDDLDLVSDSVKTIFIDGADRLWIGYQSQGLGLSRPNVPHTLFSFDRSNPFSLTHNTVYTILADRSGVIWIGTWNGLNKLSPQFEALRLLTYYEGKDGRSPLDVVAIEEDHDGMIWLGTISGALIRYDYSKNDLKEFPIKRNTVEGASIEIYDILEDSNQFLWIATLGGGVFTLNPNRELASIVPYRQSVGRTIDLTEDVVSIVEVEDGRIFFGTMNEGLKAYNRNDQSFTYYLDSVEKGLSHSYIWPMIRTHDSETWVGAFEGGLYRYLPQEDRFISFQPNSGRLSSTRIFSLFEDSRNMLWAGTAEGLNRIDRSLNAVTTYQTSDGLPHSRVVSIQEDNHGYLWLDDQQRVVSFPSRNRTFQKLLYGGWLAGQPILRAFGF